MPYIYAFCSFSFLSSFHCLFFIILSFIFFLLFYFSFLFFFYFSTPIFLILFSIWSLVFFLLSFLSFFLSLIFFTRYHFWTVTVFLLTQITSQLLYPSNQSAGVYSLRRPKRKVPYWDVAYCSLAMVLNKIFNHILYFVSRIL